MLATQDLHVHTRLSSCAQGDAELSGYVERAAKYGLNAIAVTNHYWEPDIPGVHDIPGFYIPQDFGHICELKKEIPQFSGKGVKILFGAESEYCYELRKPAITEKTASQLDFLIVPNSHTHLTMPQEFYFHFQKHADYMLQAYHDIISDPVSEYISAMAHPFAAVCCPYSNEYLLECITDAQFKECFQETAAKDIAVEINLAGFGKMKPAEVRNSGFLRMFEIARDCGCKFTFGSDSHSFRDMFALSAGDFIAGLLDLRKEQILYV